MTYIFPVTIILLVISSILILIFYFRERNKSAEYQIDLGKTKAQLTTHINSIDNLINMLVSIHDFGLQVATIHTRHDLARTIVDNATKLLRTDMGSLMLLDKATNELIIVAAKGLTKDVIDSTRLKLGEGVAGIVAKEGRPIFVENIETDVRFLRANHVKYTSKSFIAVPLKIKNRVIGVLNVNRRESDAPFSERDLRLLTLLADQSAITIENLELYQNLQQLYLETMQTLARAIDAKDAYTKDHAERAAKYARLVAEELHLPQVLIRHIEYAAMMHDIGKIGIKEEILLKPGKLTNEEYEEMKKHPLIGEKIISPIEFLAPVAPLILYHHEWFDGSGYSEGLVGEEIPIGARIVAIIDAFDAMTSDRPYRKALPKEVAVTEVKKSAGTQFDPKIVEAFLKVINREEKENKT